MKALTTERLLADLMKAKAGIMTSTSSQAGENFKGHSRFG
jgi:hypothetical protein